MPADPSLSVVVTVLNEAGSVDELYRRTVAALDGQAFELVFVDDGSTDGTFAALERLHAGDPRVRAVRLKRNDHARPEQARADVRRGVLVARLDVLPLPAVLDDALERCLVIAGDGRIGVLVDRDACGRVRDEDEDRPTVFAVHCFADGVGDIDELGAPLGPEPDLLHAESYSAPPATGGIAASGAP